MTAAAPADPRLAGPLFYTIATLCVAIGAWGVARHVRAWKGLRLSSAGLHARDVFAIALGSRLRKASPIRWLIHGLIMGGVLVLFFVGSLGDALDKWGLIHLGKDTAWFATVNNLAGAAVLVGAMIALTRRPSSSERRQAPGRDRTLILVGLEVLVLSGFGVQAARQVWGAGAGYTAVWWAHAGLALGAVALVPYTRMLHVVATPIVSATGGHGSLLAALEGCTGCDLCTSVCEAYAARPEPATAPSIRMRRMRTLLASERVPSRVASLVDEAPVTRDALGDLGTGTFSCTTCGLCSTVCSAGIDLVPLWKSMRAELASRGAYPAALDFARDAVRDSANILNYPNRDRALWVDLLDDPPEDGFRRERAEILYFVGCMSSFSPSVQSIPQAFAGVLTRLGCDFTVLGEDESCCGFPLVAAGRPDEAAAVIAANLAQVRAVGPRIVVFTCPSCLDAWKTIYSPELPGVRMLHATQLLDELLPKSGIPLDDDAQGILAGGVTYHDPCDLGRNNRVYEEPRRVLSMLAGSDLREPERTRERAHCCGGGGDLEVSDPALVRAVATKTADALAAPGARVLATACPQCKRTLASEAAAHGMRTFDVVELVWAGMGGES